MKNNNKLNPNWITDFVDAEGCFYVRVSKNKSYKRGWEIQVVFQIKLHIRDKDLLLN
jgi:RNA binding exosome subunit